MEKSRDLTAEKTKKQLICEVAARLFRDKGFSATSMRDLAEAVGLKASSLYNHIGSKQEILQDICFANAHRFLSGMEQVEDMPVPAAEKIKTLLHLHIRIATEDMTSVTAFNDEWRHLEEPQLSAFTTLRKDYENRFKALVETGIRNGEFKPLDPSIVLHSLFSAVRWLYDWYKPGGKISVDDLEREISVLLMSGLEKD